MKLALRFFILRHVRLLLVTALAASAFTASLAFGADQASAVSRDYCGTGSNPVNGPPPKCDDNTDVVLTYGQIKIVIYSFPLADYNVCADVENESKPFACTYGNNSGLADWSDSAGIFGVAQLAAGSGTVGDGNGDEPSSFGFLQGT